MPLTPRLVPPRDDPAGSFASVSRVLDALSPPAAYAPSLAAIVNVAAGETRRLAPRAAGQNVVIPASDETNYGARITLLVDGTLGSCRVRPISGTVNGASAFTLAAGFVSSLELISAGDGRWMSERAEGYPLTNGDKGDITVTGSGATWTIDAAAVTLAKMANLDAERIIGRALGAGTGVPTALTPAQVADIIETEGFTWTGNWAMSNRLRWGVGAGIADFTLSGNTDNLAIGAVNTVRILGNTFNLTGMVADAAGHVVWLQNDDAADNLVLVHDATSTAANRFYLPGNANYTMTPRSAVWARYDGAASRWHIGGGAA